MKILLTEAEAHALILDSLGLDFSLKNRDSLYILQSSHSIIIDSKDIDVEENNIPDECYTVIPDNLDIIGGFDEQSQLEESPRKS